MIKYEPRVSIVIPAYNAANYLAEAIESALAQTYRNVEVIVVNDGSNDGGATADIAKGYGGRIRYFEKENGGSSSALNYGIRNMTGEWFSWLSHDDLYYPDKIEAEINYISKLKTDENELSRVVLFSASELINAEGRIIRRPSEKVTYAMEEFIDGLRSNACLIAEPTRYSFHGCSCLIHRTAFSLIGAFDERLRLLNDVDMWFRMYAAGFKVVYVPRVLVKGRVHGKQVSKSIGYSYHNDEQDMFWNRSLNWLCENCPNEFALFYAYGRNAFLKTRYAEGKKAFGIARHLNPSRSIQILLSGAGFLLLGAAKSQFKNIYISLCK